MFCPLEGDGLLSCLSPNFEKKLETELQSESPTLVGDQTFCSGPLAYSTGRCWLVHCNRRDSHPFVGRVDFSTYRNYRLVKKILQPTSPVQNASPRLVIRVLTPIPLRQGGSTFATSAGSGDPSPLIARPNWEAAWKAPEPPYVSGRENGNPLTRIEWLPAQRQLRP